MTWWQYLLIGAGALVVLYIVYFVIVSVVALLMYRKASKTTDELFKRFDRSWP